jgi:hypothetical protein
MRILKPIILLCAVIGAGNVYAQGPCDVALVRSTFKSFSSDTVDHRLASLVAQNEYDEIRLDAGANAAIYGVPVAANYDEFRTRARERADPRSELLTPDQARNILWTGLKPNATTLYSYCLQADVLGKRGLHLAVKSATEADVFIIVSWNPQEADRGTISPTWTWQSSGQVQFPTELRQGQAVVVVRRPIKRQSLAVSYLGFTESIVLEPSMASSVEAQYGP